MVEWWLGDGVLVNFVVWVMIVVCCCVIDFVWYVDVECWVVICLEYELYEGVDMI